MRVRRFNKVTQVTRRGFSDWIQPKMKKYMMACCDCNLVHEMQFRIVGKHVQFRCRRADGYTKRERARAKRKAK